MDALCIEAGLVEYLDAGRKICAGWLAVCCNFCEILKSFHVPCVICNVISLQFGSGSRGTICWSLCRKWWIYVLYTISDLFHVQFHSRYQPAFTRTSNWTENPSTGISEEYMLAVEIQDAACMEDQALAFPRLQARSLYGRFNTAILPEIHFLSLLAWMPKKNCCLLCWRVAAFCEDFTMPLIPHHPSKNWTCLTNSHEQSFGPHLFWFLMFMYLNIWGWTTFIAQKETNSKSKDSRGVP